MNKETEPQQIPDGERWLMIMGYEHLKGQPTGYAIDGVPVPVEQFDVLCGEHARPIFAGLERLDPADPQYDQYLTVARKVFNQHFGPAKAGQ